MGSTTVCSKGHLSTEQDYCSECGVRIAGQVPGPPPLSAGQSCPDCGTLHGQEGVAFCEVCGFNFATGAHGEIGVLPEPALVESPAMPAPGHPVEAPAAEKAAEEARWKAVVSVDAARRGAQDAPDQEGISPFAVLLDRPTLLIGRTDEARAIFPEIALTFDEAVSRRHALLQQGPEGGFVVRDIGSANGTQLNGIELDPTRDYPLRIGDEITLGRWTRIRIETE